MEPTHILYWRDVFGQSWKHIYDSSSIKEFWRKVPGKTEDPAKLSLSCYTTQLQTNKKK